MGVHARRDKARTASTDGGRARKPVNSIYRLASFRPAFKLSKFIIALNTML